LRQVIDPELGVNIVDLGLVYNILIEDDKVIIEYTTTTPGCPMRRFLQQQIEKTLDEIEGITNYEAKLIWKPDWSVDMIVPNVDFFAHPPPQNRE
jgi:metal-sulfur cluster biosynthetic enzyme